MENWAERLEDDMHTVVETLQSIHASGRRLPFPLLLKTPSPSPIASRAVSPFPDADAGLACRGNGVVCGAPTRIFPAPSSARGFFLAVVGRSALPDGGGMRWLL